MPTLDLFGPVGDAFDGFTDRDVAEFLNENDGPLTVRINSPGGLCNTGVAVYHMLAERKPAVEVIGMAASAASIIAMAGETIRVRRGADMMIHDAWMITYGDEREHIKNAKMIGETSDRMAEIYAHRTGMSKEHARGIMLAETWLGGEQAVAAGFATHTDELPTEPTQDNGYGLIQLLEARRSGDADAVVMRKNDVQRVLLKARGDYMNKNGLTPIC